MRARTHGLRTADLRTFESFELETVCASLGHESSKRFEKRLEPVGGLDVVQKNDASGARPFQGVEGTRFGPGTCAVEKADVPVNQGQVQLGESPMKGRCPDSGW